ncbi:PEP-CTERM sorting domain-containing protein [Aphanothece sacrum]|uniref:Cyclophilin-type peptidylprolyl cis-trans isomerase n=1 Tax=Aphanothece sacrum FPU1 TaxID=1920663 RepID=A0A401ILG2_APHSA|nr:PEP-CTERM sorting domain-containing protein [Aphanothece sacrum]GBF82085.1 cyclophilin-type peptidylprolyl cis-trans isomerase [Aphanothece sacrum FPU1]GBF85019.1 cyclophilin-type peptidylprolyl cis-trans isomerase [Aphanothece sacrum FPU3]
MRTLIKRFGLISGILLGGFSGVSSAQAAVLIPPPPTSTAAFTPIGNVGTAGAVVKLLNANKCPVVGFSGLCNSSGGNQGAGFAEVTTFDLLPPSGSGYGTFSVNNSQPDEEINVFSNATGGRIKDFVLPYFGTGTLTNLNVALNITAFLDFDPNNGDAVTDTFDATELSSIVFISTSPNSALAQFSFNGFYHIQTDSGVQKFQGTVNLSQPISGVNTAGVITRARTANGFTTSYSGQTSVSQIPEPATLAGLAAIAGSALLSGKLKKKC